MAYVCNSCGYRSAKWMGFCPQCGAREALAEARAGVQRHSTRAKIMPITASERLSRSRVGIDELDEVLGGGIVPGAVMLLGGEPGVGKSTLLLQVAGSIGDQGRRVLLASAEESSDQVALRARRLGIASEEVLMLAESDIDTIIAAATEVRPDLLVIDSVQTVAAVEVGTAPGSIGQVRECAGRVIRFAKDTGTPAVLIGHVTKDGGIAGPKTLEHMVDVVLYLEGEGALGLRALRGLKNRFGPTHRLGLFEMRSEGLTEVADPSAALLSDWRGAVSGTVVFPTVEGRRPVLVEIQALVAPSQVPQPRRSVRGVQPARIHQVLAVLDRHAGLRYGSHEVYVNAVGGIKITEPAADLPVALALVSSLVDRPLGSLASWGEVGLTGEVRPVPHDRRRREEAARLGIDTIVGPGDGRSVGLQEAIESAFGAI